MEKGRSSAKLNLREVYEIRDLRGVMSQSDIAADYGISSSTVSRTQRGIRWGVYDLHPAIEPPRARLKLHERHEIRDGHREPRPDAGPTLCSRGRDDWVPVQDSEDLPPSASVAPQAKHEIGRRER